MLYKRLDNGKLQWPKNKNEVAIGASLAIRRGIHATVKGDFEILKCIPNVRLNLSIGGAFYVTRITFEQKFDTIFSC